MSDLTEDFELDQTPQNLYPDVYAFVAEFWCVSFAHTVRDGQPWKWCAQWWAHTEAVLRLEAAWKAWEVLRLDPGTGASVWLRDHADPCTAALSSPEGPFSRCSDTAHKLPPTLPMMRPPAGLRAGFKRADDDGGAPAVPEDTIRLTVPAPSPSPR